eukprot:2586994-Rhodomonas_salina.5
MENGKCHPELHSRSPSSSSLLDTSSSGILLTDLRSTAPITAARALRAGQAHESILCVRLDPGFVVHRMDYSVRGFRWISPHALARINRCLSVIDCDRPNRTRSALHDEHDVQLEAEQSSPGPHGRHCCSCGAGLETEYPEGQETKTNSGPSGTQIAPSVLGSVVSSPSQIRPTGHRRHSPITLQAAKRADDSSQDDSLGTLVGASGPLAVWLLKAHEPSVHSPPCGHVTHISPAERLSARYILASHVHAEAVVFALPTVVAPSGHRRHCPSDLAPSSAPNVFAGHDLQASVPADGTGETFLVSESAARERVVACRAGLQHHHAVFSYPHRLLDLGDHSRVSGTDQAWWAYLASVCVRSSMDVDPGVSVVAPAGQFLQSETVWDPESGLNARLRFDSRVLHPISSRAGDQLVHILELDPVRSRDCLGDCAGSIAAQTWRANLTLISGRVDDVFIREALAASLHVMRELARRITVG